MTDRPPMVFYGNPGGSNWVRDKFMAFDESAPIPETVWFGIDWAKDSGMNRGDIIKREGNVTHVRFTAAKLPGIG